MQYFKVCSFLGLGSSVLSTHLILSNTLQTCWGGTTSPRHLLFSFTSHFGHFTNQIQIQTKGDLEKCVFLFANSHVRSLSWEGDA